LIVVTDLESSNISPLNAELLQAAFIVCDDDLNEIERRLFKSRVQVWNNYAQQASLIHGITKEESDTYPHYKDTAKEMFGWLLSFDKNTPLVMHVNQSSNRSYDGAILRVLALDNGVYFDFNQTFPESKYISTHTMAKFLGVTSKLNLKDLATYYGIGEFLHHDAMSDCQATLEILRYMNKEMKIRGLKLNDFYESRKVKNEADISTSTKAKTSKKHTGNTSTALHF